MNGLMPYTATVTEIQRNFKKVDLKAKRVKEPLVILSNNQPTGVYIDYETFKGLRTNPNGKKIKRNINKFFGSWTKDEAERFNKVIEEEFEQINPEAWK